MLNKSQLVTVGLIQAKAHKEPSENLSSTLTKVEQAAKDGAQINCTQELFLTEYFCQCEDHQNSSWLNQFRAQLQWHFKN